MTVGSINAQSAGIYRVHPAGHHSNKSAADRVQFNQQVADRIRQKSNADHAQAENPVANRVDFTA